MKRTAQSSASLHQTKILGIIISALGIVLFGIVILGISLYGLDKRDNTSVNFRTEDADQAEIYYQGTGAQFELSLGNQNVYLNKDNTLVITVDPKENTINGATAVINFNKDRVQLGVVDPGNLFPKYTASDIAEANRTGVLRVFGWPNSFSDTVKTRGVLAKVHFTPKSKEASDLILKCDGSSISSSLPDDGNGGNIYLCNGNDKKIALSNVTDEPAQPTPTANPTNPPATNPPASNPPVGGGSGSGYTCSEQINAPTNVKAWTGSKKGSIMLSWNKVDGAEYYNLTYGEKAGQYQFGAPNVGNVDTFEVNVPKFGTRYYFVVTAIKGCASSGYSAEVSAKSGWGATVYVPPKTTDWAAQASKAPVTTNNFLSGTKGGLGGNTTPEPTVETTPEPTPTPRTRIAPTPTPETLPSEGTSLMDQVFKVLPWIGLIILIILAVLLFKFLRRGGKPTAHAVSPQNLFDDTDELTYNHKDSPSEKSEEEEINFN